MKHLTALVVLTMVAIAPVAAPGEEPARAFLDGLRSRGFHDVAIDYLDQMATSRLAPADLKETVLLEKALTLIASSRVERNAQAQIKYLDDAQALLQQFVDSQGSHPKSNDARSQLGSLLAERARMKVAQSKDGNTKQLLADAGKLYEEAFNVFGTLQARVSEELDQIPKVLDTTDRKQAKLAQRRKQLRADNLQTELLAAAIREEWADTFPTGSANQVKFLNEAAQLYDGIYKNYRGRLAGFYARMYQGRCNQRLGKLKDALGYYGELLDQPNESEEMFTMKTEALRMAMECWLAPSQRKYLETIKRGSRWLAMAPANQGREPSWLAIRLSLAKAYEMQAEAAKSFEPPDVRTMRESAEEAMKHAKFVASESGELQEEARELVTRLGGIAESDAPTTPQTFSEAQVAGKEALDAVEPARKNVATMAAKLAAESDADAKAALQDQWLAAQSEFDSICNESIDNFRLALTLADQDTPQSDVNLVRYFLCYLYYLKQDYFESALVGDFVSQRFPDSAGARQCAQISLACYLMLFDQSDAEDQQFEIERLVNVAHHMSDTWPDSPDANNTLRTLVPHMVNAKQFDHARDLTGRITESSPQRGEAELITGQAMWGAWIGDSIQLRSWELEGAPEGVDLAAKRAELNRLQDAAKELLTAGYRRLPAEPGVTTSNVTALLSLAQACVNTADDAFAVEVLEHPQLGPLTLVDQNDATVENPAFIEETYKTALQAYVGLLGNGDPAVMEKANRVMVALQKSVPQNDSGQQRLLSVYVSLARKVEDQMSAATPEAKQQMSSVFESFLQQLSSGASDPGVLNWVAETLAGIGAGFDDGSNVLNPDARKYYQQSIDAFSNILSGTGVPTETANQIRTRMATVMAKTGDFAKSLSVLQEVLATKPNAINVQVEAARILARWAQQDSSKYQQAISGMGESSKVWGWGKIAAGTMNHRQFRETFYEARYEISRCLFELSKAKSGAEKRKLLMDARRNLTMVKQLYPSLGGVESAKRYQALLNQILVAQGEKPIEPVNVEVPVGEPISK